MELVVPDIVQPHGARVESALPRRAQVEVGCITGNIMDITTGARVISAFGARVESALLGSGGKIPQLHVFQHALF